MEVIRILGKSGGVQLGDVGEGLILGRGYHVGLAVTGGLLVSLGGPLAGENEISLAGAGHQVQGNHGELGGSAAL